MGKTSIEWCDHSINPIRARDRQTGACGHYCEMISSGCARCYSSRMQKRFKMPAFPGPKAFLRRGHDGK
jgi:protein gp37